MGGGKRKERREREGGGRKEIETRGEAYRNEREKWKKDVQISDIVRRYC